MGKTLIDSNIGYIRSMPNDWVTVPGKSMFDEVKFINKDGVETNALKFTYGEIVQKENFDASAEEYVADTIKSYNVVTPSDVVINGLNLNYDLISQRVAIVRERGVITSAYIVLRPKKHVVPRYLNYQLKAYDNMKVFHGMGEGIRQTIKFDDLGNMQLLCPDKDEQKAIVHYLDSKCSAIDEAIKKHKKIIEKLAKYRKAQISATMKKCTSEIPAKYAFKIYAGATPKSGVKEFWDGDVTWITPADFKSDDHYVLCGKRKITEEGYLSCNTTIVPPNSIIVSKRAPIGTVSINKVPLCTNQGCLSCVPLPNADTEFYYYALIYMEEHMQVLGAGTTFQEISAKSFANMKLPYTDLAEQRIIANRLNEMDDMLRTCKEKHLHIISRLEEYRRSFIYHAVTGKIDCREATK